MQPVKSCLHQPRHHHCDHGVCQPQNREYRSATTQVSAVLIRCFGFVARKQAVAIVSPKNGPIYVRQFSAAEGQSSAADLRYHYFAHAGLDVMDERSSPSGQKTVEQYLGLLYTLEDLAIYGFQTSTRLRFLLMMTLTDHVVRDLDILTLFRALHTSYLKYAANPFHLMASTPGARAGNEATADATTALAVLEKQRDAHLPVNCRPIRSASFDRMVERVVCRPAPTDRLNSALPATPQSTAIGAR